VKLTDFGIAKADQRVSHTEVGMVKGNASFMSPEQARGEVVDLRSDVFSAGLVMFYCLTSQYLYRGETTLNRLLRAAVGPATSQFDQIDPRREAVRHRPHHREPSALEEPAGVLARAHRRCSRAESPERG
jgi:serine/threonine protein kinase